MRDKRRTKPKNWRKVKLGELLLEVESGGRPRGGSLTIFQGVPSIGAEHLDDNGGFNFSKIKYVPERYYKNSSRGKVKPNDVLCVKDGATIGKVSRITKNFPFPEAMVNEHVFIVRSKQDLLDQVFLFYKLRTREGRETIKNSVGGSAQGGLKKDFLNYWEIDLPPLLEQKRIASILSTFDEKIELNNKINQTLEQMAQAIFKEWFVDFKFPGHEKVKFVDSELGKIPEGWKIGYLGDGFYSEIIKYKVKNFDGEKIYLATADVVKNDIISNKTKITYENRPIRANAEPVLNSIWFAKMINTYKVLFFFDANKEDIDKYILSTGFMGIKALKNLQYYLYLFINSERFHKLKDTLVQGAVQEAITNANIKEIKIIIPPQNIILLFNEKVKPLISKIYRNKKENQKLAALRDLLLPKLMSGEIRV